MTMKTYKELHQEKLNLEAQETLASVYHTLELIQVCADESTNFVEFTDLIRRAMRRIEAKIQENESKK